MKSSATLSLLPAEETEGVIRSVPSDVFLRGNKSCVIGRGKDADVIMSIRVSAKEIISRRHAEISCTDEGVFIVTDMNSVNGVFVNGLRVNKQALFNGDVIQFGGMANMPTGKKLKQCAENAQYSICYTSKIPESLRFSSPPGLPDASHSFRNGDSNGKLTLSVQESTKKRQRNENVVSLHDERTSKSIRANNKNGNAEKIVQVGNDIAESKTQTLAPIQDHELALKKEFSLVEEEWRRAMVSLELRLRDEWEEEKNKLLISHKQEIDACNEEHRKMLYAVVKSKEEELEDQLQKLEEKYKKQLDEQNGEWIEKMNSLSETTGADARAQKEKIEQLKRSNEELNIQIEKISNEESASFRPLDATSTNESSSIGVDALREYLMCSLCQKPMVDAVVCRCSHGFCQACLESYIRSKDDSTSSERSTNRTKKVSDGYAHFVCPLCKHSDEDDAKNPSRAPETKRLYFRSEHLDSIIYLCQQASSKAEREDFEAREATNFHYLKTIGLDPMLTADDGHDDHVAVHQCNDEMMLGDGEKRFNSKKTSHAESDESSAEYGRYSDDDSALSDF